MTSFISNKVITLDYQQPHVINFTLWVVAGFPGLNDYDH
ncbi:hypothetical protein M2408_003535 [Sphingobacterium sp. BIGb0165]|nr:hypothetical protein [Sphingobacterium sp. BIGb0165]